MEENGGYMNDGYSGSIGASTISIPGAYRSTDDLQSSPSPRLSSSSSTTSTLPNLVKLDEQLPIPEVITASHEIPDRSSLEKKQPSRDHWGNDIEFLMSCIALSVGLGNVWRFPFTALDNGGGAFVIPYLIILFLVGKPVYYLEMVIGQFSSRGCVKVYDFAPIMRGIGYGQVMATLVVTTYYSSLMALTLRYFVDSFFPILPWSYCRDSWDNCIDSAWKPSDTETSPVESIQTTSAEFYFTNIVLREKDSIDDGIGNPNWQLAITLAVSWTVVSLILIKGVRSSGKASYFLAVFPYVIMSILLIRALTLPGAIDGVIYFLKPQWGKLLEPKVWYAAVTQVFFSLAICFGNIIMYASYNRFGQNIYRDANIITSLDTFTSLLSGIIIFGILGNLAYENNTTDIQSVVKGGAGLAFISYPDAIAKFTFLPQIFSVLFFLMLFVLGIGSNVGMASCIITVITDQFTKVKHWIVVVCVAIGCYLLALMYITPGGQYLLTLLDFHGASFVALVLAIFELIALSWIYGVKRLCKDVQFMLGIRTSLYYRITWGIITPIVMATILIYTLVEYEPVEYNGYVFKKGLYIFGWCLSAFGIGQLFVWAIPAIQKQPKENWSLWERIQLAFKPNEDWGPRDPALLREYKNYMQESQSSAMFRKHGFLNRIYDNIFG